MRSIICALIIALSVLIPTGQSVAKQLEDSQNTGSEGAVNDRCTGAAHDRLKGASAGGYPLIAGKRLLKRGVNLSDLDTMYAARTMLVDALSDVDISPWSHYYVGLADYQIANVLLARGKKRRSDASDHLKKAVEHLQNAARSADDRKEINHAAAEVYALLSYVYGRQISLSPIKGIYLGPKSKNILTKAERLAPHNPRVVLSSAISYLRTPRLFGGNKERAMERLRRAAKLFAREKPADPVYPAWGHCDTYIWMGIAYLERNKHDDAREAFKKALETDPDNRWAREMLSEVPASATEGNQES